MYNAISAEAGDTTKESVLVKERARAKAIRAKDGAEEKEIGVKAKESGVKAKETGEKEEKDSAEKDGVKEIAEKEEENRERLRARAKEKARKAKACMSSGIQMSGITGGMNGRHRRIGVNKVLTHWPPSKTMLKTLGCADYAPSR